MSITSLIWCKWQRETRRTSLVEQHQIAAKDSDGTIYTGSVTIQSENAGQAESMTRRNGMRKSVVQQEYLQMKD